MKKTLVFCLLITMARPAIAQDSTRIITHEFGVNIWSLFRQFNVIVPSPDQLPYDIFYNCYFKRAGIRTGLGMNTARTETQIEGQQLPRITTTENTHIRLGFSWLFVNQRKFSINGFADYIYQKQGLESSTTTTVQTFPNPVTTRTVRSQDLSEGKGFQGGVGLMLHMNRHLSFYTEAPITYLVSKRSISDLIRETGEDDISSKTTTETSGIKIAVPVTVYLVLRI